MTAPSTLPTGDSASATAIMRATYSHAAATMCTMGRCQIGLSRLRDNRRAVGRAGRAEQEENTR
jgi:hypothetical protein